MEDNLQEEEEPAEPEEEEAAPSESQPAESAETTESAESTEEETYPDSEEEISAGQALNEAGDAVLEKPEGETVEEYNEDVEGYNEKVEDYNDVVTGENDKLAEDFTGEDKESHRTELDDAKKPLDDAQSEVDRLQAELNALEELKNDPNPDKPFSIEEYNQKVAELNAAVEKQQTAAGAYNDAVENIQTEKQDEVIQENQGINSDNKDVVTENEQTMNENADKLGKTEETDQEGNVTFDSDLDVEALKDSDLKGQYEGAKKAMEEAKGTLEGLTIPQYTDDQIKNLTPEQVAEYEKVVANYNQVKADYDRKVEAYNGLASQVADALNEQAHDDVTASNKVVTDTNKETAKENQSTANTNTTETDENIAYDNDGLKDAKLALDGAADTLDRYKGELETAQNVLNELDPNSEDYYQRYDEQLKLYMSAVEAYNEAQKAYNSAVEGYRGALQGAFENANTNISQEIKENAPIIEENQTVTGTVAEEKDQVYATVQEKAAELDTAANNLETASNAMNAYKNQIPSKQEDPEGWAVYQEALKNYNEAFGKYQEAVTAFNTAAEDIKDDIAGQNASNVTEALQSNNDTLANNAETQKKLEDDLNTDHVSSELQSEISTKNRELNEKKSRLETLEGQLSQLAKGQEVKDEAGKALDFETVLEQYNTAVGEYNKLVNDSTEGYNELVDQAVTKENQSTVENALGSADGNNTKQEGNTATIQKLPGIDKDDKAELEKANAALKDAKDALATATDSAAFEEALKKYNESLGAYNTAVQTLEKSIVERQKQSQLDANNSTLTENGSLDPTSSFEIDGEDKTLSDMETAMNIAENNLLDAAMGKEGSMSLEEAQANYNTALENYNNWVGQYNQKVHDTEDKGKLQQNNENIQAVIGSEIDDRVNLENSADQEKLKTDLDQMKAYASELETIQQKMEDSEDTSSAEYAGLVKQYNAIVSQYNEKRTQINNLIGQYNEAVDKYNQENSPGEIEAGVNKKDYTGERADWGNITDDITHLDYIDVRKEGTDGKQITGLSVKTKDGIVENAVGFNNGSQSGNLLHQDVFDKGTEFEHTGFKNKDHKNCKDEAEINGMQKDNESRIEFTIAIENKNIDIFITPSTCYAEGTTYTPKSQREQDILEKYRAKNSKFGENGGLSKNENGSYNIGGMPVYVLSAMLADERADIDDWGDKDVVYDRGDGGLIDSDDSFEWDKKNCKWSGEAEGLELVLDTKTILEEYQKQTVQKLSPFGELNLRAQVMNSLDGVEMERYNSTIQELETVNAELKKAADYQLKGLAEVESIEQKQFYSVKNLKQSHTVLQDVTLQKTDPLTVENLQMQGDVEEVQAANLNKLEEKNLLTGFTDYTKTAEAHLNKAASQIKALFIELGGDGTTDPEIDPETDPDPEIDPETDPETDPDPDPETDPDPDVEIPEGNVPLAELPTQQVPLTELPEGQTPILVELTEEQVPLTELPDEAVPMARPAKTGDTTPMLALSTALAGAALALTKLLERKRHTAKHAKH